MLNAPRIDFTFSYWIFAWFLLYEFRYTKYNPKFAIILALILNITQLFIRIYYKNSFIYIFLFVFANTFLKLIPLWILRNDRMSYLDMIASLLLFIIYNVWLFMNDTNIIKHTNARLEDIKHNRPSSPFVYYVDKYLVTPTTHPSI